MAIRALALRLVFRRSPRNVAGNLVLVLYLAGFDYVLAPTSTPFLHLGWMFVGKLRALVAVAWFVRALRAFHGRSWFATIWRALVALVLHVVGMVLLIMVIAIPWVAWIDTGG